MKDPYFNNIYCLVYAERLSYQVCEAAFKEYESLSQGINGNYCMHVHSYSNQSCHKPYMIPLSGSFRATSVVDIYKVFSWVCFAHMHTTIKHFWISIV